MGIAFNPSVATVPNQHAIADANPVGKGTHLSAAEQTALDAVVTETVNKKLEFGGDDDSRAARTLHTKTATDKPADSATTEGALRWAQNVNGKDPEAVQVFLDRLQYADPKAYDYISNYLGIQAKGETHFGADDDSRAAKRISRRSVGDAPADSATVNGALRWAQNVESKDPTAVQKVLDKVQTTDRKAYDYLSNMLGIQATGEMWFGPDPDAQAAKRLYRKSAGDAPADAQTKEGALRWLNSVRDPDLAASYLAAVKTNDPAAYEYVSHYSSKVAAGQKKVADAAARVGNATTSHEVAGAESDLNKTINTTIADLQARNLELEAVYKQNSTQRPIGRGNYEQAPANEAGKAAANEIQDNKKLIEDLKNADVPAFIGTGGVAGPGGLATDGPAYVAPPALQPGDNIDQITAGVLKPGAKTIEGGLSPAQQDYLAWSIAQKAQHKQVAVPPGDVMNWNTLVNNQIDKNPALKNKEWSFTAADVDKAHSTTTVFQTYQSIARRVEDHMPKPSAGQQILEVGLGLLSFVPIPGLDALGIIGRGAAGAAKFGRAAGRAGEGGASAAVAGVGKNLGGRNLDDAGTVIGVERAPAPTPKPEPDPDPVHQAQGINLSGVTGEDLRTATRLGKSHNPSVKQADWESSYVGNGVESRFPTYFWLGALDTAKMVKADKPFTEVLGNSGKWREAIARKEGTDDPQKFGKWTYLDAQGAPTADVNAIASTDTLRTPVVAKYRNADNARYFDNLKSGKNGPYGDSVIADADGSASFQKWTTVGKIGKDDVALTSTIYGKLGEHDGFLWRHGVQNQEDLPKVFAHMQALYEDARGPLKGVTPEARLVELNEKVGHLHWWISQVCPFERGSAAAADMISAGLYRAQGFDRPSWKPGVSADVAALTTPDEAAFARNYGDLMERPPNPTA